MERIIQITLAIDDSVLTNQKVCDIVDDIENKLCAGACIDEAVALVAEQSGVEISWFIGIESHGRKP